MSGPALRLYRTVRDGTRLSFSNVLDREIPLVAGVTVLCASREEVSAVIDAAVLGGLVGKVRRPLEPGPCRFAVVLEDRRAMTVGAAP